MKVRSKPVMTAFIAVMLPLALYISVKTAVETGGRAATSTYLLLYMLSFIYACAELFDETKNGKRIKQLLDEEDSRWIKLFLVLAAIGWVLLISFGSILHFTVRLAIRSGRTYEPIETTKS
jgi:hypothetical protein